MGAFPHPPGNIKREEEPGKIGQKNNSQPAAGVGSPYFFAADNKDIGEHDGGKNDTGDTDPFLALNIGVKPYRVERTEKNGVDPYCGFPPDGTGPLKRIEILPPPVNHIHHERKGPDRISEIRRVFNN